MLYLDYVATTPLNHEVAKAYSKILENHFANVDSLHGLGLEVNSLMEKSRSLIASLLNVSSSEIIFTSGASEANNLAIKGIAFQYKNKGKHLITTMIEHSSVYETFKQLEEQFDFEVTYLPVDEKGRISLSQLEKSIRSDTILVSIMMVNNEVGIINPINEIKKIVKLHQNINLHVDMVQALGKIPINLEGIDLSTFSAHKIYGLKGSGILVKKQSTRILPLVTGGQQEFGLRPGTSNAATNIVLAKTIRLALNNLEEKYYYVKALNLRLREYFEQLPNVIINTPKENSTPYLLNISLLEYKPEVIMNALEELKIYVSTKSACSTKKIDVSRTLRAMNVPEIVGTTALRISLSHLVKKEDIDYFIQSMNKILIEIKKQRY